MNITPEQRRIIGQNSATFWYPAITDEELGDDRVLLFNYRKSLAQLRRVYVIGGVVAAVWLVDYIRFGPRKRKR